MNTESTNLKILSSNDHQVQPNNNIIPSIDVTEFLDCLHHVHSFNPEDLTPEVFSPDQWSSDCPVFPDDWDHHLTIDLKSDGHIDVRCEEGCTIDEIIEASGHKPKLVSASVEWHGEPCPDDVPDKSKRKKRNKRKKTISYSQLIDEYPNAWRVYGALLYISKGKKQINTTRKKIGEVCKLSDRVVGKAVAALHDGGWINRSVQHDKNTSKSWFVIRVHRVPLIRDP